MERMSQAERIARAALEVREVGSEPFWDCVVEQKVALSVHRAKPSRGASHTKFLVQKVRAIQELAGFVDLPPART